MISDLLSILSYFDANTFLIIQDPFEGRKMRRRYLSSSGGESSSASSSSSNGAETSLQKILASFGATIAFERQDIRFYDVGNLFARHNFARDVKRNLNENDWAAENGKIFLTESGIVKFAFKKDFNALTEKIMPLLKIKH